METDSANASRKSGTTWAPVSERLSWNSQPAATAPSGRVAETSKLGCASSSSVTLEALTAEPSPAPTSTTGTPAGLANVSAMKEV